MAGGFAVNTRRKVLPLQSTITYPAGGGTFGPLTLPKTGLLARMFLALRGTVGGTVNAANALGFASALTRTRLQANSLSMNVAVLSLPAPTSTMPHADRTFSTIPEPVD